MMKKIAAIALTIFTCSANAGLINVDYQATNANYTSLSGSFSGNDANNDGWLTFSELDNWFTNYSSGASFSALNDLGDFDYVNNIWTPNAKQWNQTTEDAYMTWNNWGYSASTSNYSWSFNTSVESSQVSEPASIALLGLGLAGIGFLRKKKTK